MGLGLHDREISMSLKNNSYIEKGEDSISNLLLNIRNIQLTPKFGLSFGTWKAQAL